MSSSHTLASLRTKTSLHHWWGWALAGGLFACSGSENAATGGPAGEDSSLPRGGNGSSSSEARAFGGATASEPSGGTGQANPSGGSSPGADGSGGRSAAGGASSLGGTNSSVGVNTNGSKPSGGTSSNGDRGTLGGASNRGGTSPVISTIGLTGGVGGRGLGPRAGAPNGGRGVTIAGAGGGLGASGGSIPVGGRVAVAGTGTRLVAGTAGVTSTSGNCPSVGHVTYTLAKATSPTADQKTAYDKITKAMDTAVRYYNCYTDITKTINVSYEPSVATADGNINGSIRFGSSASMNHVTAMHEISHTVGIGTASKWSSLVKGGVFTGTNAQAQLLELPTRDRDTIGADTQHFWPFGLNYESEGQRESDLIGHCQMVVAIRKDLGM